MLQNTEYNDITIEVPLVPQHTGNSYLTYFANIAIKGDINILRYISAALYPRFNLKTLNNSNVFYRTLFNLYIYLLTLDTWL